MQGFLKGRSNEQFPLPTRNERVEKLTDQEAFNLVHLRSNEADAGRDSVHLRLQREWWRNLKFFLGIQSARDLEPALSDLDTMMQSSADADHFTANHIVRVVAGQVARLSRASPDASVIPKSPDIEDQEGARVAQFFLDHWDDVFNFRRMRRELGFWLATCGTGFIRADWNDRGGMASEMFSNPFNGMPIRGENLSEEEADWLRENGAVREERSGSMHADTLSPFQVYVDNRFLDLHTAPWMLVEEEVSLDWIWNHYPESAPDVRPMDSDSSLQGQYFRRLHSLVNRGGYTQSRGVDDDESVTLYTYWVPPSGRMPRGAKIVCTRSTLLENSPHPYGAARLDTYLRPHLRFPVTRFRYLPMPGRFWGISLVEHLIDPQEDYNRARTQMQAIRDILSTPQWLASSKSQLKSTRNDYGDIWVYRENSPKPDRLDPPSLSQYHAETEAQAIRDMQIISAQSDASQAQVPEGVRSGVALRALQEQDMMVIGPTVEEMEDGWREVMERLLALTWKFQSEPQSIVSYGISRMADVKIFSGNQLNGNMQVRIRQGSMTPRSEAATQQTLMDMVGAGMLDPGNPEHHQRMMDAMDVGGMDSLYFQRDLDRRRANIENYMFLRPDPTSQSPFPDVDDDDEHEVHIDKHLEFKKTDAYELLPLARKMAFEGHLLKHRRAHAAMVEAQLLLMSGAAGPGGGGGGSPPRQTGEASQPRERKPTPGSAEEQKS